MMTNTFELNSRPFLAIMALSTLLTLTIGAQDINISITEGALASAGGVSVQGEVTLIGHLGGPFESTMLTNGDIRLQAGPALGASLATGKVGDFNGDDATDFSDFLVFAGAFGTQTGDAAFRADTDLDGDGEVGFSDFLIFAAAFGS